jgi:uncharacterized membrane protein
MPRRICYLGDDHLGGAAAYLAGILTHYGLAFDHVPSASPPPVDFAERAYAAYVVSDYPSAQFLPGQMERIAERVSEGAGLVMLGGWESYFGRLGEYHRSPLAEVLPVAMSDADDRRNSAQPCLIRQGAEHEILAGLPWDAPPGIGGYNAFTPKPGAEVLLTAVRFAVHQHEGRFEFTAGEEVPLLVVGQHGHGRTAALATDVAPHWVGGWVDWGDRRVHQEIAGGFIEVGNHYAEFFHNLVRWASPAAGV